MSDVVNEEFGYVSDRAVGPSMGTTGIVHTIDETLGPNAKLREVTDEDVVTDRCMNCEARLARES